PYPVPAKCARGIILDKEHVTATGAKARGVARYRISAVASLDKRDSTFTSRITTPYPVPAKCARGIILDNEHVTIYVAEASSVTSNGVTAIGCLDDGVTMLIAS